MLLQTAFACVLSRFSHESDIVMGTPIAGRQHQQIERLIGFFINTLVLRSNVSEDVGFHTLLAQNKQMILAAFSHQDVPFENLVEVLNPERTLSHSPLFQILFVLQNYDTQVQDLHKLEVQGFALQSEAKSIKYELELHVVESGDGLLLNWLYNTALFTPAWIAQLASSFLCVLDAICVDETQPVSKLTILSDAVQQKVLHQWNNTALPLAQTRYANTPTLAHAFAEQVAKTPDSPALYFGATCLSYAELDARVTALACALIQRGAGPNQIIGICMARGIDMVVAMLAVLKSGAAYLPLDPGYPMQRVNYMIADAKVRILLTQSDIHGFLHCPANLEVMCLDVSDASGSADTLTQGDKHALLQHALSQVLPTDLAYVIYTSGSTGHPKGVMVKHHNVINLFVGISQALANSQSYEKWLAVTSISFDISVLEILYVLCRGKEVVLQPDRPVPTEASGTPATHMDFSLFYFAAENGSVIQNKYALLLEGAKFADANGLSAVWVPERHFASFGDQFPNPSVAAAAVAAVTQNVTIRSGSVVYPLHDPIRIAEEWAMVDNLSQGRVEMSAASGWHPNDFVLAPQNYEKRQDIMRQGIETVQHLWQGGSIRRANGIGKAIDISLHPAPVQKTLPMWITAAGNPDTFRYAGTIGANVLTHLLSQSKEAVQEKIGIYRQALEEAGFSRDHGKVALMLHTFVGESDAQTKAVVEQPFKGYLKQSLGLIKPIADEFGLDVEKDLDAIIEMAFERYYHASSLFGTVDVCQARVDEFSAMGVDEIACLIDFGIDHQTTLDNLPNLAKLKQHITLRAKRAAYLATRHTHQWDPVSLIQQHQITHMQCTPSFVSDMVNDSAGKAALGQLQQLLVGGEALSPSLVEALLPALTGQLFNMYGPTETTVWSAVSAVQSSQITIGKPIANTQCYVLDAQKQLLPPGVSGELYIGGDGVTAGYFEREELTQSRFVTNPVLEDDTPLYRTGDRVLWTESGELKYLQRMDDQVKFRGYRIELGEIESTANQTGLIETCVAVTKDVGGRENQVLALFVVFNNTGKQHAQSLDTLHTHLRNQLPSYMVPSRIVALEHLPLTPNGKVDKKTLSLEGDTAVEEAPYVAPQTPMEEKLCDLWQQLLGLERVGTQDNFFKIGGHSLTAVRFVGYLRDELSLQISVRDMFTYPTISALAGYIGSAQDTSANLQDLFDAAEEMEDMEDFEL